MRRREKEIINTHMHIGQLSIRTNEMRKKKINVSD